VDTETTFQKLDCFYLHIRVFVIEPWRLKTIEGWRYTECYYQPFLLATNNSTLDYKSLCVQNVA